jgi:hypothetical protein
MKQIVKFFMPSIFMLFLASCGHKIESTQEAIKFLEAHEWDVNECSMQLTNGEQQHMSTGCSFVFKNGQVTLWGQPCNYTIAEEKYPDGSGDPFYVVRFYDPKNGGTECFRLYKDCSAACYPEKGQEGVFADFNDNK